MEIDIFSQMIEDKEYNWIETLPKYQQNTLSDLLSNNTPEEVAITWLTASTQNTSPFSAKQENTNTYFEMIKKELHKLLCGNKEYEKEREALSGIISSENNKKMLISSISGIIGSKVGLAATFVAPITVLIIMTITKVSLNAWCNLQVEKNEMV